MNKKTRYVYCKYQYKQHFSGARRGGDHKYMYIIYTYQSIICVATFGVGQFTLSDPKIGHGGMMDANSPATPIQDDQGV